MRSGEDQSFVREAIQENVLTADQVRTVRDLQRKLVGRGYRPRPISELLLLRGLLSRYMVRTIYRRIGREFQFPSIEGYHLVAKVGTGATGAVFEARQESLDRRVAIKVLDPVLAEDPTYVARFQREARSVARLRHPNIVGGIDVATAGTGEDLIHYLVMEFVEGKTLDERIREECFLPEKKVLEIGIQIADALSHAHENGVLHRDIKPDNILIDPEGCAFLCDLGLAKPTDVDANLTQAGVTHGTPHYMSPEQARSAEMLDGRSDLYSFGATLYKALVGRVPFDGASAASILVAHLTIPPIPISRINPLVSSALECVVLRLLEKQPEKRYQKAALLCDHLKRIARGEAETVEVALAATAKHKILPPFRGGRWLALSLVFNILLFLLVFFLAFSKGMDGTEEPVGQDEPVLLPVPVESEADPLSRQPTERKPR